MHQGEGSPTHSPVVFVHHTSDDDGFRQDSMGDGLVRATLYMGKRT